MQNLIASWQAWEHRTVLKARRITVREIIPTALNHFRCSLKKSVFVDNVRMGLYPKPSLFNFTNSDDKLCTNRVQLLYRSVIVLFWMKYLTPVRENWLWRFLMDVLPDNLSVIETNDLRNISVIFSWFKPSFNASRSSFWSLSSFILSWAACWSTISSIIYQKRVFIISDQTFHQFSYNVFVICMIHSIVLRSFITTNLKWVPFQGRLLPKPSTEKW